MVSSPTRTHSRRRVSGYLLFLLLCSIVGFSILYGEQLRRTDALQTEVDALHIRLQNDAENAAHALHASLTDLSGDLRKLSAVSSREQYARLLADIWRLSGVAGGALDSLSVSHTDGRSLEQFLTRTGDYAYTLFASVQNGVLPTETDTRQLSAIGSQCDALCSVVQERIASGVLPTDTLSTEDYYTASPHPESVPAYPSLLYDGPFSESSENAEAKGLPDGTISAERAEAIASQQFSETEWQYDGRCEGVIATYDFSGPLGESLSITERGGKALYWMTAPSGDKADPPSDEESKRMHAAASTYLMAAGFGRMHPSYAQYYAGCVVLNYAAIQDGVVLYPDLIKVYVDRSTESVIGFDARSYYSHHFTRTLPTPVLSPADARNGVNLSMQLEAITLCLIPKSNVSEVLCYECKGIVNERYYLVYLNAETGAEEEIFEVINTEEGDLVV